MILHCVSYVPLISWRRFACFAVAAFFLLVLPQPVLFAATASLSEVASNCVTVNEKFWRSCANPPEDMTSRTLFAYALALCEAKQRPERLDRLFELATEMQNRDPKSREIGRAHV